jgi:hypothetical protein
MEIDKKSLRKEKSNIELWGVLLGFPLWFVLAGIFFASGFYGTLGRSSLIVFLDAYLNIPFVLVSLPGSLGFTIGWGVAAIRIMRDARNLVPIKIFVSDSIDLFLGMNLITILSGLILHYTFDPIYRSIPILGGAFGLLLGFLPSIVGVLFVLDFLMPKLWKSLFGYDYGYFQGKLFRNLRRSWKKGDWKKDLRKTAIGMFVLFFSLTAIIVVLVLMGLLK